MRENVQHLHETSGENSCSVHCLCNGYPRNELEDAVAEACLCALNIHVASLCPRISCILVEFVQWFPHFQSGSHVLLITVICCSNGFITFLDDVLVDSIGHVDIDNVKDAESQQKCGQPISQHGMVVDQGLLDPWHLVWWIHAPRFPVSCASAWWGQGSAFCLCGHSVYGIIQIHTRVSGKHLMLCHCSEIMRKKSLLSVFSRERRTKLVLSPQPHSRIKEPHFKSFRLWKVTR